LRIRAWRAKIRRRLKAARRKRMGLKQINGNYDLGQDRILLRINLDGGEEYRLWITRQITDRFLAAIYAYIAHRIANKFPPLVASAAADFEKDALRAQVKIDSSFVPGTKLPLGETPILATDMKSAEQGENLSVDLTLTSGHNLNLCLAPTHAELFRVAFEELQKKGSWGLNRQEADYSPPASSSHAVH
jgi:hypothetical protein